MTAGTSSCENVVHSFIKEIVPCTLLLRLLLVLQEALVVVLNLAVVSVSQTLGVFSQGSADGVGVGARGGLFLSRSKGPSKH